MHPETGPEWKIQDVRVGNALHRLPKWTSSLYDTIRRAVSEWTQLLSAVVVFFLCVIVDAYLYNNYVKPLAYISFSTDIISVGP